MWTACWSDFQKHLNLTVTPTSEAECSHLWHKFHKPLFTVCFVHTDAFPFQQKKPILMGWTHHKTGQLGLWNVGGVNSSHCWQQSVHMLLSISSDTIFVRGPQNDTQKTDLLSVDLTGLSQPKKPISSVPTPLFCPQPKKPASRVLIPLICPNKRNPPLECWYHWFVPTKETHILSADTTDLSKHFALLLGLHNDSLTPLIPAQSR